MKNWNKNYNISQTALQNFNKERKKLYDDSVRNERIIKQKEIDIEELQKCLELETNNFDKIKIRFSEMEVEYENSEIVKNTDLRKYEIEKDIIQEKLDRKTIMITRLEQLRQEWTTWYEEEHQSHLHTLSQLNDLKMKVLDIKGEKEKLESDIRDIDRMHKSSIKMAKNNEEKRNESISENEKLRIQLAGWQLAIHNLEKHHKIYIKLMMKEHAKTCSGLGVLYSEYGMEYEDLRMKTVRLWEGHVEDMKITATFKAQASNYKQQMIKAKADLVSADQKYEIAKRHVQSVRNENENLEKDISRKNGEIKDLTDKRLVLFQEKERINRELRISRGLDAEYENSLNDDQSMIDTDSQKTELADEFGNNEKKTQTVGTISKSKAVQTDITNNNFDMNKSVNPSNQGVQPKSQKTLKYRQSEKNLRPELGRNNLDLKGPFDSDKESLKSDRLAQWSSSKKRIDPITNTAFQENNFLSPSNGSSTSILPKLQSSNSRNNNTKAEMYKTYQFPNEIGEGGNLFSPNRRTSSKSKLIENNAEKQARLQSVYSRKKGGGSPETTPNVFDANKSTQMSNKKLTLFKKIHKDPITGEKIIKSKANLKELIKNATARS
jgi:hypothetical protein